MASCADTGRTYWTWSGSCRRSTRRWPCPTGASTSRRVGYNGSIVNQHGLELYLVDPGLRIEKTWARIPWEVGEVAKTLVSDRR